MGFMLPSQHVAFTTCVQSLASQKLDSPALPEPKSKKDHRFGLKSSGLKKEGD